VAVAVRGSVIERVVAVLVAVLAAVLEIEPGAVHLRPLAVWVAMEPDRLPGWELAQGLRLEAIPKSQVCLLQIDCHPTVRRWAMLQVPSDRRHVQP